MLRFLYWWSLLWGIYTAVVLVGQVLVGSVSGAVVNLVCLLVQVGVFLYARNGLVDERDQERFLEEEIERMFGERT